MKGARGRIKEAHSLGVACLYKYGVRVLEASGVLWLVRSSRHGLIWKVWRVQG